jgi:hypothetical protein
MDVFIDDQSIAWEPAMGGNRSGETTSASIRSRVMDFRPVDIVHRIAPRATAIIATNDTTGSPTSYRELYEAAREPKRLIPFNCGHYDMYTGKLMDESMAEVVKFFKQYL